MAKAKVNYVDQKITERIITRLDHNEIPWRKPWGFIEGTQLQNAVSKRPYSGINIMLLSLSMYGDPRWLTFNQVKKLGGSIKGESATRIVFVGKRKYETDDGKEKMASFMKFFNVFNAEQVSGVEFEEIVPPKDFDPIERAESVISLYNDKPEVRHVPSDRAFYTPSKDKVTMPKKAQFETPEEYYATLFHELGHSTGHVSRLHRKDADDIAPFGSPKYSYEELVAEFISALLTGYAGIDVTFENSVAYIQHWAKKIKQNPDWVRKAAKDAYTASQYMLNPSA